ASARPDRRRPQRGVRPPVVPDRPREGDRGAAQSPRAPSVNTEVVVVGGGLAGIAAALACAGAGRQVTLLEARPRLGGLTSSCRRGGLTVDNGQHVFLRCCTAYRGLLDRLGMTDRVFLQPRMDVPVWSTRDGRGARLWRTDAPAPLHLAPALLRYRP